MQGKEYELVNQLAGLLRKNGDRILNGESKLSLTTQSLSLLNFSFRRYSESKYGEPTRDKKKQELLQRWKLNVQYLHDFITKTMSLKITHSNATMQGPIFISRFRSVEVLELKRVPIHMLEGLHRLRGQLRTIIVSRCLNNLQDLFEVCGGDQSSPMSWPSLKCIFLSYNGLKKLDSSLRLLPVLEVIDISHNDLHRTENCLEHLTDICRVNLGFNSLDSIPSFSLTAKSRIKTLVLRNNNLDNIEGLEEINNIEELDLSENCLCDHSCLAVLSRLNKLVLLSLQGNPLSFHNHHRGLTIQHLSLASSNNSQFMLDGKKITDTERVMSQRTLLSPSRRPSEHAHNIITNTNRGRQREAISASYTFDDSDDIATNLKVGSPGTLRSRSKKKKRSKAKLISDEELADSSMTENSSRESSRAPSPEPQVQVHREDVPDAFTSTKEEIHIMREHYGENWLQVITAQHEKKFSSSNSSREMDKTEDDIYLNESQKNLLESSPRKSRERSSSRSRSRSPYTRHTKQDVDGTTNVSKVKDPDDDIEVLPEPENERQDNTIRNVARQPKRLESEESVYTLYRQQSSQETVPEEAESEYYGDESEPFIVMLPNDKLQQLIISIDNRYLIEKDLNGDVIDKLDLKSLITFNISMETVENKNVCDDFSLPVCEIKFDYLRKDRRTRKYVLEGSESAKDFRNLLQPFLDAKEIDRQMEGLLQCLKCSKQFDKSEAEVVVNITKKRGSIKDLNTDKVVQYRCPKCGSEMVVELDLKDQPTSLQNTPVGSFKLDGNFNSPSNPPIINGNTLNGSPVAKSSPKIQRFTSTGFDVMDGQTAKLSITSPPIMSNSDMIRGSYKQNIIQKSYSTGTSMCDMDKSKSEDNVNCTRNGSWSEFTKSMDGNSLKKRNSVDSDITILTNDSSSIMVISESSNETLAENYPDVEFSENRPVQNLTLPLGKTGYNSSQNAEVEILSRKLTEISEEGSIKTPMGSPLSSSICSSMVSSMYENTITSPSSENLHQETVDPYKNCDNGYTENNNGHEDSIYDVYKTTENGKVNPSEETELDNTRLMSFTSEGFNSIDTNLVNEENSLNDNSTDLVEDSDISNEDVLKSFCDIDFTNIDHRFKLFLTMNYLEENEQEKLQCSFKVDIVQYMDPGEFLGFLVISTDRIFIFRFTGEDSTDTDYDTCLKYIESQPITELQYIDIGLGYQSLRFEFSTECSSYTFIIRDEGRCKQFINLVTSIVQDTAFSENSKLEGISKYNAETMDNLTDTVTKDMDEEEEFKLVRYVCGFLVDDEGYKAPVGIVVTEEELIMVTENHQWPLPRLQAPLDTEIKGQQFIIKDRQKINNIATVETCEDDTTQIRLAFFNEESQQEVSWHISMETDAGVMSLVNAIREPWENEFGIELDVTQTSFLSDS